MELMGCWWIPRFAIGETRSCIMAGWRRAVELAMTDEEIAALRALSRSRTELASRVSRAQMLLAYRENPSFCAVGQRLGVHHQTVQRCVERALADGVKVLGAVLDHGLAAVESACAEALEAGLASGDVILTVLARRRQPTPPPSITTPDALRLKIESTADCGRYDSIRKIA
jgi:hypothetical protein